MKKRILVTGVAGFIGSNLADRLLKEGYTVAGIDNLAYGVESQIPAGVEFHKIDVRSRDIYPLFSSVDVVFHLAAKNCLADCQKDPVETADINVTGTVNVFEAAHRANVRKVVYAESSAVYEERALGFYAVSKTADNLFARAFREGFGVVSTGLRYFNVYGPRQDYRRTSPPVMSSFVIALLSGKPAVLYEGSDRNARDFVFIDDINDFHLQCITDPRTDNAVFDIGSGKSYSIEDIYNMLSELTGRSGAVLRPPRLADDPALVTLAKCDAAKALGWSPKTDIRKGLSEMIVYVKQEIKKGNIT